MGMEVLGATQAKPVEVSVKPANQGGATATVAAQPTVQPTTKAQTGTGAEESYAQSENGQASEKQIRAAIEHVQQASKISRTKCEFSYHEATKRVSIKVIDKDTDEVIKEIPPEKSLEMVEKMWELAGILVDEKR
jgi:flagellar protein FlaG